MVLTRLSEKQNVTVVANSDVRFPQLRTRVSARSRFRSLGSARGPGFRGTPRTAAHGGGLSDEECASHFSSDRTASHWLLGDRSAAFAQDPPAQTQATDNSGQSRRLPSPVRVSNADQHRATSTSSITSAKSSVASQLRHVLRDLRCWKIGRRTSARRRAAHRPGSARLAVRRVVRARLEPHVDPA